MRVLAVLLLLTSAASAQTMTPAPVMPTVQQMIDTNNAALAAALSAAPATQSQYAAQVQAATTRMLFQVKPH